MKKLLITLGALGICAAVPALAMSESDMAAHARTMAEYTMKTADTNGDGMISKSEWDAYRHKQFMEEDVNHDGKLSMKELEHMYMKEVKGMEK